MKYCHSTVLSVRRVRRDDTIPSRPAGVDSVCCLFSLEDSQFHVGLGHPPQRRLQSPVTAVTDVVGAKTNRYLPPRSNPGTPTHPPPTDTFLSPDPDALPTRAYLSFRRYRPRFPPFPTLCCSPWYGVLRSVLTQGK